MLKKIVLFLVFGLAVGLAIGLYLYNKPHETAADIEIFEEISAHDLYAKFSTDQKNALATYLNKNLLVTGSLESFVQDSSGTKWTLSTQSDDLGVVTVTFAEPLNQKPTLNQSVKVQGLCAGFLEGDELLGGEIQLNQAVVAQ
jgi:hypothetical protein